MNNGTTAGAFVSSSYYFESLPEWVKAFNGRKLADAYVERKWDGFPDWDFHWRETYRFGKPLSLPKGTVIHLAAVFDNSADNPNNPNNPIVPVSWGEGTTDEMVVGYVGITLDQEWLSQLFLQSIPHPGRIGKRRPLRSR